LSLLPYAVFVAAESRQRTRIALLRLYIHFGAIKRPNSSHVIPISLEITILLLVGFFGVQSDLSTLSGKWIAFQCSFPWVQILW
jgi:hypothetical protein